MNAHKRKREDGVQGRLRPTGDRTTESPYQTAARHVPPNPAATSSTFNSDHDHTSASHTPICSTSVPLTHMSHTSTVVDRSATASASTILLSPSKRRRIDGITTEPTKASSSNKDSTTKGTSDEGIWKWTFTADAVAPCFVQDAYTMRGSGIRERDFFWLGRVPCRTVQLVGTLVGVTVYEKKTSYLLDDGTEVIDCIHTYSSHPKRQPQLSPPKTTFADYVSNDDPLAKYRAPKPFSSSTAAIHPDLPPPPPEPVAEIGQVVRVQGKVVPWHETRRVIVDSIVRCLSRNEEPQHWLHVLELHKSSYHSASLGAFTIPTPPPAISSTFTSPYRPSTHPIVPHTPSSRPPPVNPAYTSSGVASVGLSPIQAKSPPHHEHNSVTPAGLRLRHPSRLRSQDLTENTFRLYLKHYMNNAPPSHIPSTCEDSLATPTDPRPSKAGNDFTPRASRVPDTTETRQTRSTHSPSIPSRDVHSQAFTLSHLRRVPELALLARRVCDALSRRAAREAKKAGKPPPSQDGKLAQRTKSLFIRTLVKLMTEGMIILSDGTARPLPDPTSNAQSAGSTQGLWRLDSSSASAADIQNSAALSVLVEDDVDALSDPGEGEDAYLPVTPANLTEPVAHALGELFKRVEQRRQKAVSAATIPQGVDKESIVAFLRRSDERWRCIGEWTVADALVLLEKEERVWVVGNGRWEPCE